LDFLIRHIGTLDQETRDHLLDDEVLTAFAKKINAGATYLVSTMNLLRTLYRLDTQKAFVVFTNLTPDAIVDRFFKDPPTASATWLAKMMEIFKNIYWTAPKDARESVRPFVRKIIEGCRAEFITRIMKYDPFITQLHWMLKRLHGLGLDPYFMEAIAPEELIELIRRKDTNVVELSRYILSTARSVSWATPGGEQRNYYEILKENLTYDDLKRVFDNRRSDLFKLAINATHDFVAKALVTYASDPNFSQKVVADRLVRLQPSMNLISANPNLTESERKHVLGAMFQVLTTRLRK
jgi:hypothetical protein